MKILSASYYNHSTSICYLLGCNILKISQIVNLSSFISQSVQLYLDFFFTIMKIMLYTEQTGLYVKRKLHEEHMNE